MSTEIIRERRCYAERRPVWILDSVIVSIGACVAYRGHRPPEIEVELRIEVSDQSIRGRRVKQCEQTHVVFEAHSPFRGQSAVGPRRLNVRVVQIEPGSL